MSNQRPTKAFILGAGFGTRMRPLTNNCPKPMLEIAGRTIIWRILDKLRAARVTDVVVNTHYLAEKMQRHMEDYVAQHNEITIYVSYEKDILDTGGGVKKALKYFDSNPFYVIAGDSLWEDGNIPALDVLSQSWNSERMDILTLFKPINQMTLSKGVGDYDLTKNGKAIRSPEKEGEYMWTNIRLNSRKIYEHISEEEFSFLKIMDECQTKERLYALSHDANWHHISTPEEYQKINDHFKKVENVL